MSYTPGPWHCSSFRESGADPSRNGIDIGSDDNLTIGLVCYDRDELTPQECKANARLIAAAPELVAALETMAEKLTALEGAYRIQWGDNSYTTDAHAAGAKARALLKRIKGE